MLRWLSMLHMLLDAGIWGHAITHPVTVLFLLQLWLSACPALVWVEVGQIPLLTFVFIHFLYTLFTIPNVSSHLQHKQPSYCLSNLSWPGW